MSKHLEKRKDTLNVRHALNPLFYLQASIVMLLALAAVKNATVSTGAQTFSQAVLPTPSGAYPEHRVLPSGEL